LDVFRVVDDVRRERSELMEPFGELHYREFSPVTMFIRYFLAEKMFVVVRQKSSPFFKISRFKRAKSPTSRSARGLLDSTLSPPTVALPRAPFGGGAYYQCRS